MSSFTLYTIPESATLENLAQLSGEDAAQVAIAPLSAQCWSFFLFYGSFS